MDSSDLSDGPITLQEYLEVKKALASSEAKVQQLMKVNNNLSEELRRLQKEVGRKEGRRKGRTRGFRPEERVDYFLERWTRSVLPSALTRTPGSRDKLSKGEGRIQTEGGHHDGGA